VIGTQMTLIGWINTDLFKGFDTSFGFLKHHLCQRAMRLHLFPVEMNVRINPFAGIPMAGFYCSYKLFISILYTFSIL
jgi:hypothetical protein